MCFSSIDIVLTKFAVYGILQLQRLPVVHPNQPMGQTGHIRRYFPGVDDE